MLQSIITDAKRKKKGLTIAWLDLRNAFGSVPHKAIFDALQKHGLNHRTRKLIFELYDGEHYTYLGRPTGYRPFILVEATVSEIKEELTKLDGSDLAPWQKLEATNVFILTRVGYLLKSGFVLRKDIEKLDDTICSLAKG